MADSLEQILVKLGRDGCQGTAKDFAAWASFATGQTIADAGPTLQLLIGQGIFKSHPDIEGEFILSGPIEVKERQEYLVSGNLRESPIQMVRSRLESYLRFHGGNEDFVMDVSIATTEAMENAVKYSDHSPISIRYSIENHVFHITITNRLSEVRLEKDIEAGKYTSTTTLMRGMMVMVKLFDEMDIEIKEEEKIAVFSAQKKLT
ncbi:MAG: ATP-binding protein [Spirochaetia bacterium]|nr:ATP-binding protein [Spirochaetia bacterium]